MGFPVAFGLYPVAFGFFSYGVTPPQRELGFQELPRSCYTLTARAKCWQDTEPVEKRDHIANRTKRNTQAVGYLLLSFLNGVVL
jgi:hypothetical protein